MLCPACEKVNPPMARLCEKCGSKLPRKARRRDLDEDEEWADESFKQSPFSLKTAATQNVRALVSYWCGLGGLVPFLGLLLGPAAVILGILGLRYATANPKAKGKNQAMAGLVLGSAEFVLNAAGTSLILLELYLMK